MLSFSCIFVFVFLGYWNVCMMLGVVFVSPSLGSMNPFRPANVVMVFAIWRTGRLMTCPDWSIIHEMYWSLIILYE